MHFSKKCLLLILPCCLLSAGVIANDKPLWQDQANTVSRSKTIIVEANGRGVKDARALTLNTEAMKSLLLPMPSNQSILSKATSLPTIELPLPDGSHVTVSLESTTILPTALAKKFSGIRTYKISKPEGDITSGRVDFTDHGFHAMLQTFDGQTIFIDPASKQTTDDYLSYKKTEQTRQATFQCSEPESHAHDATFSPLQERASARTRSNEGLMEYRIAIAASAEYTQLQGGTVSAALSAITTTLNRVNHVYEQSLGIRLSLVEKNDQLIYIDSTTDPYSNYDVEHMLEENQHNLDLVIGSNNYDIGHVFGTSGGGMAYIGSVCSGSSKARGASGIQNPNNDSFDIDYVAHEIGHQFGATHTFNSDQGICTSSARTAFTAFEPGSGSSIMSYAGGCGSDNLQSFADAMFHSGNIEQINKNILSGVASSCGTLHQTNNSAPIAAAGSRHIIPANTPFELTANAVDADDDVLRYSWEQIDAGSVSPLKLDVGNNPLFRVLPPTGNSIRSFPAIGTILGNSLLKGETLPSTARTMNFQLAVYDGHHVPSLDQVTIDVIYTDEGFRLHNPASQYKQGSDINIYWNTGHTQLSPINCSSVDLTLSLDGGKHFDIILANQIANNGVASIYLPDEIPSSNTGRFKLSCSNNIFFSISSSNFAVSRNTQPSTAGPRGGETTGTAETSTTNGGGYSGISLFLLFLIRMTRKRPAT